MKRIAPILFITGCSLLPSVGPDYTKPEMSLPSSWKHSSAQTVAEYTRWWELLKDDKLNEIIKLSVERNHDLEIARSRVIQAKAERVVVRAGFWPDVRLSGGAVDSRISQNSVQGQIFGGGGQEFIPGITLDQNLYDTKLDATWEIDIFGGTRRDLEAATASLEAEQESARATLISVIGEVALNYFTVRGLEKRVQIAIDNSAAQQQSLDLVAVRTNLGLASELDLKQAETQLETTRAGIPTLESQLASARNNLAFLLGMNGSELDQLLPRREVSSQNSLISELPPTIASGVPSDVLRNRPDIRQAERNLAASTALIGSAIAELFPKFTLSGNLGLESLRSQDLFGIDSKTWNYGPRVSIPIFRMGSLLAQIDVRNEQAKQAMKSYERTVLKALAEGDSSLAAFLEEHKKYQILSRASQSSGRALELSKDLYQRGLEDFLRVLEAQRAHYLVEEALAISEQQLLTTFATSYKVLGFGWQS